VTRLLALGKKCGISLDEMHVLTVQDLLDIIDEMFPDSSANYREATQADIDRFFRI
jgi:hypothetical protein